MAVHLIHDMVVCCVVGGQNKLNIKVVINTNWRRFVTLTPLTCGQIL